MVDMLGPYDDEVPWLVIIAKWSGVAILLAMTLEFAGLKGDPWVWITSGIAIFLLAVSID